MLQFVLQCVVIRVAQSESCSSDVLLLWLKLQGDVAVAVAAVILCSCSALALGFKE